MSEEVHVTSSYQTETSGWVIFAATMFAIVGVFNFIQGIVFLVEDTWTVLTPDSILVFDLTTWGWILLILGVVEMVVAWGILSAQTWARIVGIIIATVAAVLNLLSLSIYPIWGLIILVLQILVIYALAVHGDEVVPE
jgi:hypothetical protein